MARTLGQPLVQPGQRPAKKRQRTAAPAGATETEIKLALPGAQGVSPDALAAQLARVPALARRKAVRQQVYSVYYDTPDQQLRRQRVALRLRRVGSEQPLQWLQTLKTAGRSDSALSQRGEWEMPVPGPALALELLHDSPWPGMDPDGTLAPALAPCFVTDFERTVWRVTARDGSEIEVALDVGTITAGHRSAPLCELELELVAGPPGALFSLARRIARTVAVLPLAASKAQRGYALGQADTPMAVQAQPPVLSRDVSLQTMARSLLGEALQQFTANLHTLLGADGPELVHQARVGWRRFRSLWRLLRPALPGVPCPALPALQPLLDSLGALRDVDVAATQTLPLWTERYVAGDASRAPAWQALQTALLEAAQQQRLIVRQALAQPAVGAALLELSQWLESLEAAALAPAVAACGGKRPAVRWLRRRVQRLLHRLERTWADAKHLPGAASPDAEGLHRVRILSKRLRYSTQALSPLLPRRLQRQHDVAQQWQTQLGTARDVAQASALAARWGAPPEVVGFLRGAAAAVA